MKQERDLGKDKKLNIARQAGDNDYSPLYAKMKGNGKVTIDHKRTAHLFVKLIVSSGVHPLIQKIMSMRLLGCAPHYIPMTKIGVALALGIKKADVKRWEREGIDHVQEYFRHVSIEEAKGKYNQNAKAQIALATNLNAEPSKEASEKEE